MLTEDLGLMPYRAAWDYQQSVHEQVLAGAPERILFVEHPPVITLGRRPEISRNLIASQELLASLGVDLVQSDRGGDITFHGPGQLVAYPIIRLADHKLSVSAYVHALEDAIIATLADLGVESHKDPTAVGVWTQVGRASAHHEPEPWAKAHLTSKIAAIGVRVRRGVTLHGLALNLTTDLSYFNLIVPCGLTGRPVTSLQQLQPAHTPDPNTVKSLLANRLIEKLNISKI